MRGHVQLASIAGGSLVRTGRGGVGFAAPPLGGVAHLLECSRWSGQVIDCPAANLAMVLTGFGSLVGGSNQASALAGR